METYEQTRERHAAAWGAALPDHLARLTWSRAELEAARDAALRRLVAHARSASPWHARRLSAVDVDALTGDDLQALPTMTKDDLMADFDEIVTDPRVTLAGAESHLDGLQGDAYHLDDLHVVASGGSSGTRGVFVYGWDAWIDVHLGISRVTIADRLADPDAATAPPLSMAVVAAAAASHMTAAVAATFRSPLLTTHPFPVTLPLDDIVAGLNAVQPTALTTYASMLGPLAAEAEAGRLRISPTRIMATSEPLLPEVREAAVAAFGAPVANCWAASETGIIALGCWRGDGMHLNEDLVIVEPVDADGRPVPPGVTSHHVVVTNLINPLLPLIRYEISDEVTVLDEPCPCGSARRRVADVEGRSDDLLHYAATTVHPHVIRSVLSRFPTVREYQVRQTAGGVDVLLPAAAGGVPVELASQVAAALEHAGVERPVVEVVEVAALERTGSTGKLRRFVPLPRVSAGT